MAVLLLKRASGSRPSGQWNEDDYDVLANGVFYGWIECCTRKSLFPLTCQIQKQLKEIDEAQVEQERAPDRQLLFGFGVEVFGVLLVDRLRIPRGQSNEDDDTNNGHHELERARHQKDVREPRDQDADQAHDEEGPERGKVAPGPA